MDLVIKQMNGHSGCKIYLCEKNNHKYVRKVSASEEYNVRLEEQMRKQSSFRHSTLNAPKILSSGFVDELYYFDMEFISGVPLHNHISLNNVNDTIPIIDALCKFLEQVPTEQGDMSKEMREKSNSLSLVLPKSMHKYLDYCTAHDWTSVSMSENHGDLTFENVLVYRNKIFLIDFLDSFVQTKYIDYAKLMQDVMLGWSWRHHADKPLIKNIRLYNRIMKTLSPSEVEISKRFLVLNLLRIVPYSNDTTLKYLKNRLQYLDRVFEI